MIPEFIFVYITLLDENTVVVFFQAFKVSFILTLRNVIKYFLYMM